MATNIDHERPVDEVAFHFQAWCDIVRKACNGYVDEPCRRSWVGKRTFENACKTCGRDFTVSLTFEEDVIIRKMYIECRHFKECCYECNNRAYTTLRDNRLAERRLETERQLAIERMHISN
jgi:hypothetical protein